MERADEVLGRRAGWSSCPALVPLGEEEGRPRVVSLEALDARGAARADITAVVVICHLYHGNAGWIQNTVPEEKVRATQADESLRMCDVVDEVLMIQFELLGSQLMNC